MILFLLFIFGCGGSLLLGGPFSSSGEWELSLVLVHGLLPCGFSCLGVWAPVVPARGLSSCSSWAPEHRLSGCGTWALPHHGMWGLPRSGMEPMSPALAGGFFTTEPQGKPQPQD